MLLIILLYTFHFPLSKCLRSRTKICLEEENMLEKNMRMGETRERRIVRISDIRTKVSCRRTATTKEKKKKENIKFIRDKREIRFLIKDFCELFSLYMYIYNTNFIRYNNFKSIK